jgi:hypothetical protein
MAVRVAALLVLLGALAARGQELLAPARVTLHEGAAPGDALERTTEQRGVTTVERTAIVGRDGEALIIEKTGPAWAGLVLRLTVDRRGRVTAAAAGGPGETPRAIGVAKEEPAPDDGERAGPLEEVTTPAGTFRCRRRTLERQEPLAFTQTRWVVEEGKLAGLLVRVETRVAGRTTTTDLVALEETVEKVGVISQGPEEAGAPGPPLPGPRTSGRGAAVIEVPCLHATRRTTLDGVASPPVEEWVARRPLPFGESLVRLENGLGTARITAIARER